MPNAPHRYFSYLLRIWETSCNGEITWRVSLERPGEKTRYGFSDLEDAFEFIQDEVKQINEDKDDLN